MAEGFRFMPLGLVRLRTFRLSTWVSYVNAHVRVVHRCQNKNPIERLTSGCEWHHAPEARALRIWGDFEIVSKLSWVLPREKTVGFRLLAEARLVAFVAGATRDGGGCGGGRWKSQNRKNVYLSPYVEEPLNSKVIKSFVPEQRNRQCFSCFEIPMFYVYMLWTFYCTFFTHSHIMGM